MTDKQAEFILSALDWCGVEGIGIQANYSGRGMYGKDTYAITCPSLIDVLESVLTYVHEGKVHHRDIPPFTGELYQDEMGKGVVLY